MSLYFKLKIAATIHSQILTISVEYMYALTYIIFAYKRRFGKFCYKFVDRNSI